MGPHQFFRGPVIVFKQQSQGFFISYFTFMTAILKFILGILFLIFCCYQLALFYVNEIKLPVLKLDKLTGKKGKIRILAVDPHPDDETMLSGGFIEHFSGQKNIVLKHVCFTCGEKGDELLKVSEKELAEIRIKEYSNAIETLGCDQHAILHFPDGALERRSQEIRKKIDAEIAEFKPNVILTYERAGLYGHPDHIALSKAVHELVSEKYPDIKVLYKTLSNRVLKWIKLPYHMANGLEVKQAVPKYRLPVWRHAGKKYQAARQHKSQNLGQGKPLWLLMLLFTNEYFTDEY